MKFLISGYFPVGNRGKKIILLKGNVETVIKYVIFASFSLFHYLLNSLQYNELSYFSTNFCPYYYYY